VFFFKDAGMTSRYIIANLNARLQPLHRGGIYEDPLNRKLEEMGLGEVTGGGTLQRKSGEIENCDIEIRVNEVSASVIQAIRQTLEDLGAPKGSKLTVEATGETIPIGASEGLAVYLNGTDLPDRVYKDCDSNFVLSEFNRRLAGAGSVHSHWHGPAETAFYLYGPNAGQMETLIRPFLDSYPLCQKCRLEKIA
jgi:hypothetical protein